MPTSAHVIRANDRLEGVRAQLRPSRSAPWQPWHDWSYVGTALMVLPIEADAQ